MKTPDHVQLRITHSSGGTVMFAFPGRATAKDIPYFEATIQGEFKRVKDIRRMVLDLTKVDPVINAAGRVLDLARAYGKRYKRRGLRVQVHITKDVYQDIQRAAPDVWPEHPGSEDGLEITLFPPNPLSDQLIVTAPASEVREAENPVVLTCSGKVRRIQGESVTVSLFVDDGEILGELATKQFPEVPKPGQVFKYSATVESPGKTSVNLFFPNEDELSEDEILTLWTKLKANLPRDEESAK